jgi:hypothetical protein
MVPSVALGSSPDVDVPPLKAKSMSAHWSAAASPQYEGIEHPVKPPAARRSWPPLVEHELLDDLICPQQQRLRNRKSECLRGLHVDHRLEPGRLLDWQVGRLRALEDLVHVGG